MTMENNETKSKFVQSKIINFPMRNIWEYLTSSWSLLCIKFHPWAGIGFHCPENSLVVTSTVIEVKLSISILGDTIVVVSQRFSSLICLPHKDIDKLIPRLTTLTLSVDYESLRGAHTERQRQQQL